MNPKAIEQIEKKIKGSLLNCYVKDSWPQFEFFKNHVDSLGKEVLKHKKQWLEISDVFSIFYDFVYEAIIKKEGTENKIEGMLWDLLGETNSKQLVNELKKYFCSIPRKFDIYIQLPYVSDIISKQLNLSDNLSFEFFEASNEVPGGYKETLFDYFENRFELKKVYLRQRLTGYCSRRLENITNRIAIRNFKILIQQGISNNFFKIVANERAEMGVLGYRHHSVQKSHLIIVDTSRDPIKTTGIELPIDFSKFINMVHIDQELIGLIEKHTIDITVDLFLKEPIRLIDCTDEEATRVKSASQWCFDSYISENKTLSFLQICIGLEALLGDEGYNGSLTETLADRCAYLISGTIKGRKKIKEQFKELYDARSKLVHGNATELTHDQLFYHDWGQGMLEAAIKKEIKHLSLLKK